MICMGLLGGRGNLSESGPLRSRVSTTSSADIGRLLMQLTTGHTLARLGDLWFGVHWNWSKQAKIYIIAIRARWSMIKIWF